MSFLKTIKQRYGYVKEKVNGNHFENILWLVDFAPSLFGFSVHRKNVSVLYFVVHFALLVYVYGVGNVMYQVQFAEGIYDFIMSYVSVSVFVMVSNISFWWIIKRSILKQVLEKLDQLDQLACASPKFVDAYMKRTRLVKLIVIGFYVSQLIDAALIYLPHKANTKNNYNMVSCVGIQDLTKSPNREICLTIQCIQELSLMNCCLNYQALLVCFVGQTANMYHVLSLEMLAFNDYKNLKEAEEKAKELLPGLIYRHILLLALFDRLKALYTFPLGVDFSTNAICLALIFYLPLEHDTLIFIPVVFYCAMVFFLYCFLFQKLTNAAEEFERAVYGCGWENFNVKEKKIVFIMLKQAQEPIVLRAANIIPVSIYTFATTLQAIFKFATVFKV